jgi:hypothetical protein
LGKFANVDAGTPKYFASTSGGVCPIQSLMLNVPNSEKYPLSNTRTKRQSSVPMPWIEWPNPRGKYQTSPAAKSTICDWPCGLMVVTRHCPLIT